MNTNHRNKSRWSIVAAAMALLAMTAVSSAQNDATLSSLVSSTGPLTPEFTSAGETYTATVPYATTSVTVTPTATDLAVLPTITVNGATVVSGSTSDPILLGVGDTVISTVVTAQDMVATKTYTLTVTRGAASTNADLSGLVPSAGKLNPVFDSGTIAYTATVQFSTSSMTVKPTKADANATITVNGNPVASGSPLRRHHPQRGRQHHQHRGHGGRY